MGSVEMDKLDMLILGATGFTGKHTVKNLVKILKASNLNFTWGISGRSKEKIQNLLSELEENGHEVMKIPVIECDIAKDDIRNVTRRARILLNCTGPNTVLSEPIVKACIETKTHYVDISAELYHMINLYRKFHKNAEDANVLVVPACGFASIPAASGLIYLENNFKGTLKTVECHIELIIPKRIYLPLPGKDNCIIHYGTWASLVHELQNMSKFKRLQAETFPEQIYEELPREMKRSTFHRHKGRVWYPYLGPDESVIDMSQRYLFTAKGKKPYHFKMYSTMFWFLTMWILPILFIYYYLCYLKCFRHLLWKYPRVFTLGYISHKGPSEQNAKDTKFHLNITGKGVDEDMKEKSLTVKVSGSDPGYETTSILLITSALTILTESDKVPKGGVIQVGAAFQDTQIAENVARNKGLTYEIVEN